MLIGWLSFELILFIFALVMLFRPGSVNRFERRVLCAMRLKKRETLDSPVTKRANITTAIIGAGLLAFIVSDWSGARVLLLDKQVPTRSSGSLPSTSIERVDKLVLPEVRSGKHIGLVVGIVDNGRTWTRGYGRISASTNEAPDAHSIFEIGSVTKTFTCSSLALMCKSGEVHLNDPLSEYLPKSVHAPEYRHQQITLEDLATQTSGLPRLPDNIGTMSAFQSNPYAGYGPDKLYQFLNGYKLTRSPGSKYEYSNLGVGLLGLVLSRKSGTSYEKMVCSRVCKPLGMGDTAITLSGPQKSRLVPGYAMQERLGRVLIAVPTENWTFQDSFAGAGALRSTADDMLKYVQANIDTSGTNIGPALAATHKARRKADGSMSIGLGWHRIRPRWSKESIIWHNGGTGGYVSFVGFCKERKLGVVVLSNSTGDVDLLALRILKSMQ